MKNNPEEELLTPSISFMLKVHDAIPGITELVLDAGRAADGRSSYEILCDAAEPLVGRTVVDLACGSGRLSELLVERVGTKGKVIGIDLSQSELALAQQRLHGTKCVQFLRESVCCLSLPNASMDAVLCHMAFMLFQPINEAVVEIARILRPGGVLAVVIPSLTSANELFTELRASLARILELDVAKDKRVSLGDAAAGSINGIEHTFSGNGSFQSEPQLTEFEVILRNTPENLAIQLLPFFYYSHLLSAHGKASVQKEWLAILDRGQHDVDGKVALGVPLSVFVVKKH